MTVAVGIAYYLPVQEPAPLPQLELLLALQSGLRVHVVLD